MNQRAFLLITGTTLIAAGYFVLFFTALSVEGVRQILFLATLGQTLNVAGGVLLILYLFLRSR